MTTLHAALVAPAAHAWLSATHSPRVLNVFDRACNLVNETGAVLSIVTHERGMTPFGLMLEPANLSPFQSISAGGPVHIRDHTIIVGEASIAWGQAHTWDPLPDWPALRLALLSQPERLGELADRVLQPPSAPSAPDSAAAPPTASLLDLFTAPAHSALTGPLRGRLAAGAADLISGLAPGDQVLAIEGGRRLAGVGGGLTPAGDDFAVGAFLAAWAGLLPGSASGRCTPVAEAMAPLTTALSAAYLLSAARGECSAHWHALFAALTEPEPPTRRAAVSAAVAALFALGHTSGADGLAGFLAYNQMANWRIHENLD